MRRVAFAALLALVACSHRDVDPAARLAFIRDGKPLRTLSVADLERTATPRDVAVYDPEYDKQKHLSVLPLAAVVEQGFGADAKSLAAQEFVLRAADGYTVPIDGARLMEKGGALAVADLDVKGWEAVGARHVDPGPLRVVWLAPGQRDADAYPRPWQLVAVEQARFESVFPHTVPSGQPPGSPAMRGFGLFRRDCIHCHAINREGGHVGPDLNVPRSIVEYRPITQIRQYIRNPQAFRYSVMPPHPGLGDADLDALIAYFQVMATQKFDSARP